MNVDQHWPRIRLKELVVSIHRREVDVEKQAVFARFVPAEMVGISRLWTCRPWDLVGGL